MSIQPVNTVSLMWESICLVHSVIQHNLCAYYAEETFGTVYKRFASGTQWSVTKAAINYQTN
jgi:hypothetical protein